MPPMMSFSARSTSMISRILQRKSKSELYVVSLVEVICAFTDTCYEFLDPNFHEFQGGKQNRRGNRRGRSGCEGEY